MKQLTFQFEGYEPAAFPKWKESEQNANQLACNAIILKLGAAIERITGVALTHRHAVGGLALVTGFVLATGADGIVQGALTLAAFATSAICFHEKEKEGGEG